MKITIQPDGAGGFDGGLKAVFAEGLEELAGSVPEPWRCYAQSYFVPVVSEDALKVVQACAMVLNSMGKVTVRKVGGGVKPPRVTYQVEPRFTPTAREMNSTELRW